MNLPELRERLAQLNSQAHEIYAAAEGEKRDLSVEETEKVDAILAGSDRTKADIDRLEKLGRFPRRIRLGTNTVAWREDEVDGWSAARQAERRPARTEHAQPKGPDA